MILELEKLTCLYKDDLLSPSNRFLDSNSGIPGEIGKHINLLNFLEQLYFENKQFLNNFEKIKDTV